MAELPGKLPRRAPGVELDFTFLVNRVRPAVGADLSLGLQPSLTAHPFDIDHPPTHRHRHPCPCLLLIPLPTPLSLLPPPHNRGWCGFQKCLPPWQSRSWRVSEPTPTPGWAQISTPSRPPRLRRSGRVLHPCSPAGTFRWNTPGPATLPRWKFVEKAAQTLVKKFGPRSPQQLLIGQLNPGSPDPYYKSLARTSAVAPSSFSRR